MNTNSNLSGNGDVALFVEQLGKALLFEQVRENIDMVAAAQFCHKHQIVLAGKQPTAQDLEASLRQFFHENAEFYAEGVNVDGYERRVGWDNIFMVRAYPWRSNQGNVNSISSADAVMAHPIVAN